MSKVSFTERFFELSADRTSLCVGVDPSRDQLSRWGLPDNLEGLHEYCEALVTAAAGEVAVIKPQAAFFERHGPDGMRELQRVVALAKAHDALVIVDAKRGDISSSAVAYGEAYLGKESAFGADAITLHAYLGIDALSPIFDIANERGCGVFVVVRSSNPEGQSLQEAKVKDNRDVAGLLSNRIGAYHESIGIAQGQVGPVGAVIGATLGPEAFRFAESLTGSLILAPGIGAQGATISDSRANFRDYWPRVIPSISRNIAAAGPTPQDIRECIREYAVALRAPI